MIGDHVMDGFGEIILYHGIVWYYLDKRMWCHWEDLKFNNLRCFSFIVKKQFRLFWVVVSY